MGSWKQRLHALLLRRLLGQFLAEESLSQLHDCIDISLQDGTITLQHVQLSLERLNQHIACTGSGVGTVPVVLQLSRAQVARLEIVLRLEERGKYEDGTGTRTKDLPPSSSFAWRALQLGSSTSGSSSSKISLIAAVTIEGLELDVIPGSVPMNYNESSSEDAVPATAPDTSDASSSSSSSYIKSMISHYLEIALASLRLSLHFRNVSIRSFSSAEETNQTSCSCVELQLRSATYGDLEVDASAFRRTGDDASGDSPSPSTRYESVLSKVIEFSRITLLVRDSVNDFSSSSSTVALLDDNNNNNNASKIIWRAVECNAAALRHDQNHRDSSKSSSSTLPPPHSKRKKIQQEITVSVHQRMNVCLDLNSLVQIKAIAMSYTPRTGMIATAPIAITATHSYNTPPIQQQQLNMEATEVERADFKTIDGIMHEYSKARLLAEQNYFRGGILLPSEDGDDDLDAFFDANDRSVGHFSTLLSESLAVDSEVDSDADKRDSSLSFVHTEFRFHLMEGGVKIVFTASNPLQEMSRRRIDEYLLLSFSDLAVACSSSRLRLDHSFSFARIDVEDSQLLVDLDSCRSDLALRQVDIGTVLKFSLSSSLDSRLDLVMTPPCLAVSMKQDLHRNDTKGAELEVIIEPLEIVYRDRTIQNLRHFVQSLNSLPDDKDADVQRNEETSSAKFQGSIIMSCPTINISIPVPMKNNWSTLYARKGYVQHAWIVRSSLGICLQGIEFAFLGKRGEPIAELVFANALFYTHSPNHASPARRLGSRLDVLSISSRSEIDPITGIRLKLWIVDSDTCESNNKGVQLFPKVPEISSFKARQEDEDDGECVDHLHASNANEFDVKSNKPIVSANDSHQLDMLEACASSSFAVDIQIPEVLFDLSCEEIQNLMKMVTSLSSITDPEHHSSSYNSLVCFSISVTCESVIFEVVETSGVDRDQSSFLIHLDMIQCHTLYQGAQCRQIRLLANYLGLIHCDSVIEGALVPQTIDRQLVMLRLGSAIGSPTTSIMIYKNSLFPAMSLQSPVVLIDLIFPVDATQHFNESCTTIVYTTLYDLTYRVNYDQALLNRVERIFNCLKGDEIDEGTVPEYEGFKVVRLLYSMVDCNFDYASSLHFTTPSRVLVRIGDLRISSNIVYPRPSIQSFSIAMGDLTVYVAKTKFPYSYENSQHPWAAFHESFDERRRIKESSNIDSVHKAMALTTVAVLDSLEATIRLNKLPVSDTPKVQMSLTVGELGMYAAKDTFARLVSTLSEVVTDLASVDAPALEVLRSMSYPRPEEAKEEEYGVMNETKPTIQDGVMLEPTTDNAYAFDSDFMLDGYDWTTIDTGENVRTQFPPGEEQSTRWYPIISEKAGEMNGPDEDDEIVAVLPTFTGLELESLSPSQRGPRIVAQHFPFHLDSDPVHDLDKNTLERLAGTTKDIFVAVQFLLHDFRFKFRFFDGFDWPDLLNESHRHRFGNGAFILDELIDEPKSEFVSSHRNLHATASSDRKKQLMSELIGLPSSSASSTMSSSADPFHKVPLPEERGAKFRDAALFQKLARRSSKYFQVSGSGVSVRLDSLEYNPKHRLASNFTLSIQDLLIMETISSGRPVKFACEWVNESEHPRDSKVGLFTMKSATWHPMDRVTPNNDIVNDESEVLFQMLPLRCTIDQKAVRFIRAFFLPLVNHDDESSSSSYVTVHNKDNITTIQPIPRFIVPSPLIRGFHCKSVKLKIYYRPEKLDTAAICNGALVELINLTPIDGLVLMLKPVRGGGGEPQPQLRQQQQTPPQQQQQPDEMIFGYVAVLSNIVNMWIQDVCTTQLHKFVTSARAVDPFASVGSTVLDLAVLPWEAIQNGENVRTALRVGTREFSSAVVTETLSVTSHVSKFMADRVARVLSARSGSVGMNVLPSRPLRAPRDLTDTTGHVVESLTRGMQAAGYRVVIVPYREYRRSGVTGAITSILTGIPVAIAAPTSGAAEALSFAALGARNRIRPDLVKEEEASTSASATRGLHYSKA